jgi:aminopeptidase-like protein
MYLADLKLVLQPNDVAQEMYQFIHELYPICRSITGNGTRETLHRVKRHIPLEIHEVPTGTTVFDWTVPQEWNIKEAYIKDRQGRKIIDFHQSNLHVVNYSIPIKKKVGIRELKEHIFTLPEHPDWIPYRTAYYQANWGFCLSHKQYLTLEEDEYEVCIDSSLEDGSLTYGEYYLRGETADEVLLSCHICHPSLCNDNLSGIALVAFLAKHMRDLSLRHSYRFLFIPGTIGSITWLCFNEVRVPRIKHGLVVACVGDAGKSTYKKSRRGDAEIDKAVMHVLRHAGKDYAILDFVPYGYDERQFCSPGFNLPVGCLMRTPDSCFPEYHTSADNLEFVHPAYLADSFSKYVAVLHILENNKRYVNKHPKCEPQLGKRGLYRVMGGKIDGALHELAMLWVLNFSDGQQTLLAIAERAGLPFEVIKNAADALCEHDLLAECAEQDISRSLRSAN